MPRWICQPGVVDSETRPDIYIAVSQRHDAGLKLRGGSGKIEPLPSEGGIVCGYPELLARHLTKRL